MCFENNFQHRSRCPACNKDITRDGVVTPFGLRNFINSLELKCPTQECDFKGNLEEMSINRDVGCPEQLVICPNVECEQHMRRKDKEAHLQTCEFQNVKCEIDCNLNMSRRLARKNQCHRVLQEALQFQTRKQ